MWNIFTFLFLALGLVESFSTTTCVSRDVTSVSFATSPGFVANGITRSSDSSLNMYPTHGNPNTESAESFGRRKRNFKSLPHPGLSKRVSLRYSLNRRLQLDSYQLRRRRNRSSPKPTTMSAMANSDVLPSFHAAHGLLHPHTVMKLQEQHDSEDYKNEAVTYFLDTYDQYGPMACLPCLTDPQVLPDLTNAMRKINS